MPIASIKSVHIKTHTLEVHSADCSKNNNCLFPWNSLDAVYPSYVGVFLWQFAVAVVAMRILYGLFSIVFSLFHRLLVVNFLLTLYVVLFSNGALAWLFPVGVGAFFCH